MPIESHYYHNKHFTNNIFIPPITMTDVSQTLANLVTTAEFSPDANALFDLRALDFSKVQLEHLFQIIKLGQQYPQRGQAKIACLVSNDLAYGTMRMYQAYARAYGVTQDIQVFREAETAEAWLTPAATMPVF